MESLDQYEQKPKAMLNYLAFYGWHFNKKMCQFALEKFDNILNKDKIDSLLETYNITLEHNQMYDYVYITNYLLSLYFKSSINDEKQLIFLVKDTIDKNKEGIIFTQWYASMCKLGIPIEWEDMI